MAKIEGFLSGMVSGGGRATLSRLPAWGSCVGSFPVVKTCLVSGSLGRMLFREVVGPLTFSVRGCPLRARYSWRALRPLALALGSVLARGRELGQAKWFWGIGKD